MNKLARAAATSQTLSLTAMEEASRLGQREADLDHLLLALTLSDQPAGQVLRSLGVSLQVTRRAVTEQRVAQLQSIGVLAATPEDGRITFHETGGYEWSTRAREIIVRSAGGKKSGDAGAVLRELLSEPSGLIDDLLRRMDVSPAALLERLEEVESLPVHAPRLAAAGEASGFTETFVPASVADVWALLSDPGRMPEWDPACGGVDAPAAALATQPATTWLTHQRTVRPDGKPLRVRDGFGRRRVELLAADEGLRIAWRFTYPDAARSNPSTVEITLSPAAGGSQLGIALTWRRGRGWRRVVGFFLGPLRRFAIWMQLFQLGGGISRVFR